MPALGAIAVNPPFTSPRTVNPLTPEVCVIEDGTTVRGNLAPSVQPIKTPGVLMARYVAILALNVVALQAMPLSTMFEAPRVTLAVIPEEQVVPVTVPFAQ